MDKRENRVSLLVTSLVCLVPLVMAGVFYSRLPEQIVTHWGIDGMPDGTSSKITLFVMPFGLLLANAVLHFFLNSDPKRKNTSRVLRSVSKWLLPITSILVQGLLISTALGAAVNVGVVMPAAVGVLFIFIGNYLPKCKQNYTMGIKLPWTLDSEENWNKTHRMAGYLWVAAGVFIVAISFTGLMWLMPAIALPMALIPCIYSYLLYRKEKM